MGQDLTFLSGMLVGFLVATAFGVVMGRIRVARGKMGARGRPQTVLQKTAQTPDEVVRSSVAATFSWLLWIVILILLVSIAGLAIYYAIP